MAFTTRRGRPPKAPANPVDVGTPELRFKQAHGLTAEPIDLCLERQLITSNHHRSGLHLRWLYTVRYGAPNLTTRYDIASADTARPADDPNWRRLREAEYRAATALLHTGKHYEPVMRLCIYNQLPAFLNPHLHEQAWHNPALAQRMEKAKNILIEGLDILEMHWNPTPNRNNSALLT